jgi:quercetin dioxygenase-like cupin family protein
MQGVVKRGRRTVYGLVAVTAFAIVLVAVGLVPSRAQEPPPPIALELLSPRSTFTDDVDLGVRVKLDRTSRETIKVKEPSRTVVVRITIQPGVQVPWHTHSGPAILNVAEGELISISDSDCIARSYPAGKALVDLGRGHLHSAFNPTTDETVVIATFFEVSEAGPITITEGVEAPEDCQI